MQLVNRQIRSFKKQPGTVEFDELGNAQYQWQDQRLLEDSEKGDTRRHRALAIANLVLVDDEPPPDQKFAAVNKHGTRLGYNPYDSGRLQKTQSNKRVDLRELSKWIEARNKQANGSEREAE